MTPRAWLALCLCFMLLGGLLGWAARVHTVNDRLVAGLAMRYEASTRFYNERTDQLIHANQPKGVKP